MGEEENVDLEEQEEGLDDPSSPKKGGLLSPMIIKVLMGVSAVIVMSIVSAIIAFIVTTSVSRPGVITADVFDEMVIPPAPDYYEMGEFSQNTADIDSIHFIKVKITLTYKKGNTQLNTELTEKHRIVRDILGDILAKKLYNFYRDPSNRDELRKEIKNQINMGIKSGEIEDVLFDDFLVN